MKRVKLHVIFVLLLAVFAVPTWSADVYVRGVGGNDANDGFSTGTAKATLAAAITVLNAQAPGSTLHIEGQMNYDENTILEVLANGTPTQPITIMSDPVGSTFRDGVFAVSGEHVVIQDLAFDARGNHEACVVVYSGAADCTIDSCTFAGVGDSSEHFNTEAATEVDIAPVQVLGASGVTINDSVFNEGAGNWNCAVLYGSATGPGSDFTVDGCVINSDNTTSGTLGILVFRAVDNIQVLNCQFNDMEGESFQLNTNNSTIDNGTSSGVLIQDCTFDGFASTSSQYERGAMRFVQAKAEDVTIRRCVSSDLGNGGHNFIMVNTGAEVYNMSIEDSTFARRSGASEYQSFLSVRYGIVNSVTIDNMMATCGTPIDLFQSTARVYNLLIRNSTTANPNTPGNIHFRIANGVQVYGFVIENCYFEDSNGGTPEIFSIYGAGTYVQDFTLTNVTLKDNPNTGAYTFEVRSGAEVKNLHIENCLFDSGSYAFHIANPDTVVTNIDIINSEFKAAQAGDGTAFVLRNGSVSVTDCVVEDCTFSGRRAMAFWTGTFTDLVFRNSTFTGLAGRSTVWVGYGATVNNASFDSCEIGDATAGWGIAIDGSSVMDSFVIDNCTLNGVSNSFTCYDNAAIRDSTITNSVIVSGLRANDECDNLLISNTTITDTTTVDDPVYLNCNGEVTIQNCSISGGNSGIYATNGNTSGITIGDVTIDAAGGNGSGINIGNCNDVAMSNVAIFDASPYGIAFGDGTVLSSTPTIGVLDKICVMGSELAGIAVLFSGTNTFPAWTLSNATLLDNPIGLLMAPTTPNNQPVEITDSIIASASGTGVQVNTLLGNGISISYSALVEEGLYALDTTEVDSGGNSNIFTLSSVISANPIFLSINRADAAFLDVDSDAFSGKGSSSSNLSGFGDYVGGTTGICDWRLY
jgi:hypothetical protein